MSGNAIAEMFAAYLNDFFIQVLKAATTLFWLLEKVAAGCMRFLTGENLWELLVEGTINTLKTGMPDILSTVFFGGSTGVGMLYLALMLAGIFMIIPALNSSRPVEVSRAIVWGVFVTVLFISGVAGYDFISYIEGLRQNMTTLIVSGVGGGTTDLDNLVQTPMYATDGEIADYGFALPAQFETSYFTAPDPASDYTEYQLVLGVWPVQHTWAFNVESQASQADRRSDAQTGLAVAALVLIPGTVLLLFGLIYAVLAAAALILVIFFIVSLPVGFFEFGTTILTGIVRQYMYLFAITLLTVTLVAVMVAGGQLDIAQVSSQDNPNNLMTKIPILLVVMVALSYVSSMATKAMTDSFGVVSTSVQSAFAPLNAAGRMPTGSGVLSDVAQAALNVTGAAVLAGANGGMGMAVTAGAGALLNNMNQDVGRAAASLAQGAGAENQYAQVFGSAARGGRGMAGIAMVGGSATRATRTMRQRRAQADANAGRTFGEHSRAPRDRDDHEWDGQDEGTFQVADSELVEQGIKEFREGNKVTARSTLTRAYGSREVAEQVMGRLEADPKQTQLPVAKITDQVRQTAHQSAKAGKALFDAKGNLTPEFQRSLWQNMKGDKSLRHLNPADAAQAGFVGAIAGASVRPLAPIWDDPLATRKLAQKVLDPDMEGVKLQDHAALLNLQGLAHTEGWKEADVEALFEATRSGQSRAALGKGDAVGGVVKEMATHKELQNLDPATAKEAARLALLVTRQGQSVGANGSAETPVGTRDTRTTGARAGMPPRPTTETPVPLPRQPQGSGTVPPTAPPAVRTSTLVPSPLPTTPLVVPAALPTWITEPLPPRGLPPVSSQMTPPPPPPSLPPVESPVIATGQPRVAPQVRQYPSSPAASPLPPPVEPRAAATAPQPLPATGRLPLAPRPVPPPPAPPERPLTKETPVPNGTLPVTPTETESEPTS